MWRIAVAQTAKKWPSMLKATAVVRENRMLFGETGTVGWGGNSGFQAINLALQFGAARLLLVGFDCRVDKGSKGSDDDRCVPAS